MGYASSGIPSQIGIGGGVITPYTQITTVAADLTLSGFGYNSILRNIVGDLVAAYLDINIPRIVNTSANPNGLFGIQYVQIRADSSATWVNAIKLYDQHFSIPGSGDQPGSRYFGQYDTGSEVQTAINNAEDLHVQLHDGIAMQNNLRLYEVQPIIKIITR